MIDYHVRNLAIIVDNVLLNGEGEFFGVQVSDNGASVRGTIGGIIGGAWGDVGWFQVSSMRRRENNRRCISWVGRTQ